MFFGFEMMGKMSTSLSRDNMPNKLFSAYKTEAQKENAMLLEEIYNRFSNLAVTRIKWNNLPETVSERFLNISLYLFGSAAFFRDPTMGFLALPCTIGGEFNVYYDPTIVTVNSFNYTKTLNQDEFVYIRNNPTTTPTAMHVFTYAKRMSDTLRSIDVNVKKLKQPYLIQCEEKERITIENLIKKVQDNEIMVIGSKQFGLNDRNFEITPLPSTSSLSSLWETYVRLENMMYTVLGINSPGFEKKERLVVDEVNANNMVVDMAIEVNIKELQLACDKINKLFGLNISVEANKINNYGGVDYGSIYDDTEDAD